MRELIEKLNKLAGTLKRTMAEQYEYEKDIKIKTVFGNMIVRYENEETRSAWDILDGKEKDKKQRTGYSAVIQDGEYNGWNAWDTSRQKAVKKLMMDIASDYGYKLIKH